MPVVDPALLGADVDQAPRAERRRERQRDVLADRALHQQGLGAVGRDVDEAGADGVGRVPERDRPRRRRRGRRSSGRSAPARMSNSSSWPWPSSATTPRTSPAIQVERDVVELGPECRFCARMRGTRVAAPRASAARSPVVRSRHALDDVAEHERDDPLLRALGDVDDADRLAFAQDGRPVADGGDLDQAVRDEDDRAVRAALTPDDLEDAFGQVGRQRGGHLVEHQDVGSMASARARSMTRSVASGSRRAVRRQVESRDPELAEPGQERARSGSASGAGSTTMSRSGTSDGSW